MYCIADQAGTGKSTIALTMVEEWRAEQCFDFFFSKDSTHKVQTLCVSLAKQIIGSCYGLKWDEYWAELSSVLSPSAQRVETLWNKLVYEPLRTCGIHERHVVVVDALDECDQETRAQLLKCLLNACISKSQPQTRLLFTTRKEDDIRSILEMDAFHDAILPRSLRDSEKSQEDIERYIDYRLKEAKVGVEMEQRRQLVGQCDGLFIFASLACDLLQSECAEDQSRRLRDMIEEFTSLDTLYHRTLSQAVKLSRYAQTHLMDILRVIVAAREPLSISAIAALLPMKVDTVNTIVKKLGSILGSGDVDQSVYIFHATLKEFLLRKSWTERTDRLNGSEDMKEIPNQYYIDKEEGERAMLKGCLSNVMADGLIFNICSLETSFLMNEDVIDMDDRICRCITDALQYSCLNWTSHLESISSDPEIMGWLEEFMNNQFLSWLEVLSVTKCVRFASKMLGVLIEWMRVSFRVVWGGTRENKLTYFIE